MSDFVDLNKVRALAALGLCVIPIRLGTKKPAINWREFQHRKPTHDELEAWFLSGKNTWAVVTGQISRVIVVDCDSDRAREWADQNLEHTPLVVRTRKGEHRYYLHHGTRTPNKARIRTAETDGLELDLRGDGGYVLGPLASHMDGGIYEPVGWRETFQEGGPGWEAVPFFDPTWLAEDKPESAPSDVVRSKTEQTTNRPDNLTRCAQYIARVPGAGEGSRNSTTSQVAYKVAQGWDLIATGFALVENWNSEKNNPPLDKKELRQIWGSACKASPPPGKPRGYLADEPLPPLPERPERPRTPQDKPDKKSDLRRIQTQEDYREAVSQAQLEAEDRLSDQAAFERKIAAACSRSGEHALLLEDIKLSDFSDASAIEIASQIRAMLTDGIEPSPVLIRQRLANLGMVEVQAAFDDAISSEAVAPPTLATWSRELLVQSTRRRVLQFTGDATQLAHDKTIPISELREKLTRMLSGALSSVRKGEPKLQSRIAGEIARNSDEVRPRLSTGFSACDRAWKGGVQDFEFVLLAGGPASGKSSLALQWANLWATQGPVYYWTGEMSEAEITRRSAAQHMGTKLESLDAGRMYEFEDRSKSMPVWIDEEASLTVSGICNSLRMFKLKHPDLKAAVLDYLGLVRGARSGQDSFDILDELGQELKTLSRALEIPILGVHQMNGDLFRRQDKTPCLDDVRGNKKLTYDADKVLILIRPHVYDRSKPRKLAELWSVKDRHNEAMIKWSLDFDGPTYSFTESKPAKKEKPESEPHWQEQSLEGEDPLAIEF